MPDALFFNEYIFNVKWFSVNMKTFSERQFNNTNNTAISFFQVYGDLFSCDFSPDSDPFLISALRPA